MRNRGLSPDEMTTSSLLCACRSSYGLNHGKQIHSYIIKMGFDLDVLVCNSLTALYTRYSSLNDALRMFGEVRNFTDASSWNSILGASMQQKQSLEVFNLPKLILVSHVNLDYVAATTY